MSRDELPETFIATIEKYVDKFPNDVNAAVDAAYADIAGMPEFDSLVKRLVQTAIRHSVYDLRHSRNVASRNGNGHYMTAQNRSLKVGDSKSVKKSFASVYTYYIAGKQLGDVKGEELDGIANGERNRASGHLFNARLCDWLKSQGVKGDKRVRSVVSEKKLGAYFRSLQEETEIDAA